MAGRARTGEERRAAAEARRTRRAEVTDPDVVMEAAAAFLAIRPRAVLEVRQRLLRLGYPEALTERVVDRLVEVGYLDDRAFAVAWVESRDRARPRGRHALRRELLLKGVAEDVITDVLEARAAPDAAGHDWGGHHGARGAEGGPGADVVDADTAGARRLLERRAAALRREPDARRRRQRAYALLAARGFAPDVCAQVATAFLHEADADDEALV